MKYFFRSPLIFLFLILSTTAFSQYTHQDTLRGSIGPGRDWWNVLHYDIWVQPDYANKSITGICSIQFMVLKAGDLMQIDLQEPLMIDSIHISYANNKGVTTTSAWNSIKDFKREGNVYWVKTKTQEAKTTSIISIYYHGNPRVAVNPPWDGGWIFTKDEKGRPWMTVACQGLGASVWYPCKDHQSDEPDNGARLAITVPDSLVAVGNGRLISKNKQRKTDPNTTWTWEVKNPINNYNIIPYIGKYVTWHEDFAGEKGKLDCDYWVMDYSLDKAKAQFGANVKPMLKCFEYWLGPYPFYEDGYKLVETPHLGMEHQSAVAYGNHFVNGYYAGGRGRDLSGSGWGMKWDYIIVHESGHEWFANNITTNDIADMWVHEGFTDYSEPLFVECQYGKQAADEYTQGLRRNIRNDRPVIGPYGVNKEGSGDMYAKGANLLHTIRQVINNDSLFRNILRGLNKEFYHKTVDSKSVEAYMSKQSGKDLSKIFDQYLRATKIPTLEYKLEGQKLSYRWANCIDGFDMPIEIISKGKSLWLTPRTEWQEMVLPGDYSINDINKNFYIILKSVQQ